MVTTTVFNRVKAGMLASMLALSLVTTTPVLVYAAPKSGMPAQSIANQGKHLGQLKKEGTTQESTSVVPETSETPAQQNAVAANHASSRTVVAPAAHKQSADPAGNNGTVKIDRAPFDNHPDNEPHVTCSFRVDFYGFDYGVGNANVTFELQPPTKDGRTLAVTSGDLTPNIGEDAAKGGTDLDASETYTLAFTGAAHEKQGYHVKLTVNAPGSQGADTKHKVFWVEPCETPETPDTPVTPVTPNDEGGQILGDAAKTSFTAPAVLPSTGAGIASVIVALVLMAAAYAVTYRTMIRKHAE